MANVNRVSARTKHWWNSMPKIKLNDGTVHKLGGGSYVVAYVVGVMIFTAGFTLAWALSSWLRWHC
jgi:hypothetical protein